MAAEHNKIFFGREFYVSMFLDQFGVTEFIFDVIFVIEWLIIAQTAQ